MRILLSLLLCLLITFQIKADKADDVVKFAKSKLGCGYVWSGYGQKLTEALLKQLHNKYPDHVDTSICKQWIGKQIYDCSGLVQKAFETVGINLIHNADSAWKNTNWVSKGTISNYPKDKVLILFKNNGRSMSIQGVYVGGGEYVYCKGPVYGVVKGAMPGPWTHWAIPKGLY